MPEVETNQDTPQESNLPAFVTDAPQEPDAPEATPPTPQPKEEPVPEPEWLSKPIDSPPQYQPTYAQPQYVPQYPPQQQFVPQYAPQPAPPPPPPSYTLEQFVQDPTLPVKIAKQELMREFAPMVGELQATRSRLQVLDNFGKQQHESAVAGAFEQTRAAVREKGYKEIFAKDPAFRNPAVQQRVDQAVRGYLARATEQAHVYGDFSGYQSASRPSVLKAILQWAKDEAGWTENAGKPILIQGGFVETGRSQPQQSRPDMDEGLVEAAREMKVDPARLARALDERKKLWGLS